MSNFEEYLATLDPKIAKNIKLAKDMKLDLLPLASIGLTNALGGGIGKGRITLLYGNFAATKTALMLESIGKWQKDGLVCGWVDAERGFRREWAESLGVDVDKLIVFNSKSSGKIEDDLREHLLKGIDVVVIDSISAILPEVFIDNGELKGGDDRKQIGAHAKAITSLINGLQYLMEDTAVVLISQTTTDLGSSAQHKPQAPHGGKKVRFAASQVIKLTSSAAETQQIKGEAIKGNMVVQAPIGRKVEYLVEKNRMGRPFIAGEYNFYYAGENIGVDSFDEVVSVALDWGIIEQKGAWFTCTLTGVQYQGKNKLLAALKSDPAYWEKVRNAVEEIMSNRESLQVEEEEDEL